MDIGYLFYWIEENKLFYCPEEIKFYINKSKDKNENIFLDFGNLENIQNSFNNIIKKYNEIVIFPIFSNFSFDMENKLTNLANVIKDYSKSIIIHEFPLLFIKNDCFNRGLFSQIKNLIDANYYNRVLLATDKYKNNLNVDIPIDWLVIFKNLIDLIKYVEVRDILNLKGIIGFGCLSKELSIRKIIINNIIDLFNEYREHTLGSESKSPFNFELTQISEPIKNEILNIFKSEKLPDINNTFGYQNIEYYLYLLPENENIKKIEENDFLIKLQNESKKIVNNVFSNLLEKIKRFFNNKTSFLGETLENNKRKNILDIIKNAIERFIGSGGTLYVLEKWLEQKLNSVIIEIKEQTNIFQPKIIVENKENYFVSKLKDLCWILLKYMHWKKFSTYKYLFLVLLLFFSALLFTLIIELSNFKLTFELSFGLLSISGIVAIILTLFIRMLILQSIIYNARNKLEELSEDFQILVKDMSSKLHNLFLNIIIEHYLTKINIYIQKILSDIQEICLIYRRVLERTEPSKFSISNSNLIDWHKFNEKSELENIIENNFNKNKSQIFQDFFSITSEQKLGDVLRNFLQKIEDESLKDFRANIDDTDFNICEDDLSMFINKTRDYILLPANVLNSIDIETHIFLCKPRKIRVEKLAAFGNLRYVDWDINESILSFYFVKGINFNNE